MNPIVLALIGIPFMLGIYFRFYRIDKYKLNLSLSLSFLVFAAVGIGYAFATYSRPKSFFIENSSTIGGVSFLLFFLSGAFFFIRDDASGCFVKFFGLLFAPFIYFFIYLLIWQIIPQSGISGVAYFLNVVFVFVGIGLANAMLGTIVTGFTISASVHAFVMGNGLPDIYIWKNIFEFLDVSSAPLQILIIVAMALASAGEAISNYFE